MVGSGVVRKSVLGRVGARLGLLDEHLVSRSARIPPTAVDRTLLTLSRCADHSVLWGVVAGGLVATGGRNRRAAVRGLLAVGCSSFAANAIAKPLFPRRRPPDESVPFVRRLINPPVSSSFPSGHSASAAAFATAVAIESPGAGLVVAPVAAAVAYSRVHIGVHWPSDVVVGAALGTAIALGTRRWWAVRTDEPAVLGPEGHVEGLARGHGLLIFANPSSGSADELNPDALRSALPEATVVEFHEGTDLADQIDSAITTQRPAAVGVVGGDGTVLAVATAAVRYELPLAVFPGGTLNHFARDAGVDDPDSTVRAVEAGEIAQVDAATVDVDGAGPDLFLNTASLGGYPDVVRLREKWQPRLGKWPAAAAAMVRVLARAEPLSVRIDGTDVAIWMLFVGNGRYHPADRVPMSRPELHRGLLDVRYLRADMRFSRIRLIGAVLAGTLGDSKTYVHRSTDSLDVEVQGREIELATDGEVPHSGRLFRFGSDPKKLSLFRAQSGDPSA